ncbi:heptosyltransferase-2 [Paucidesulfovibrio gracilis DSM 16080]|uniref:Heptosyltransferase-2 n=1 Tax=Paucidesulfovibrio gracilis DSM 16080 TaxID=1121449 RepID=A0A1T4XPP3_9BACT|nr:glycosyltransferase family 9 protein [Paucidesulfovibrio gracilis]SKA91487.1 heptosyltransferase-2 [Paucidesulfovibrio gracilis DSM 16080]
MQDFHKILICQQHQIGDVLLATPCVRLLHERFPQAELHFLTEQKCRPMLENNPLLTKIWTIDKKAGLSGTMGLYSGLLRERFDLAIDLQQFVRLRLATLCSRAPVRLSYKPRWYNKLFYNRFGAVGKGYAAKAKAGVLEPLGVAWSGQPPELHLTEEELAWGKQYLAKQGVDSSTMLMTLDMTHRRITRKWPAEYYARLLSMLAARHPRLRLFLLYGPGEEQEVRNIWQQAGNPDGCILPEKQTTLREVAAIIRHAHAHFGNCSSPRHLAVAVGTPSMAVLGSNKPGSWTFPSPQHGYIRNERPGEYTCLGCNKSTCRLGTLECLYALTPELVYERIRVFFHLDDPDRAIRERGDHACSRPAK